MALEQASSPGRCRCSEAFARALLAGRPLPDPPPAAGASSDDGSGQSFEGAGGRAFRATPAEPVLPVEDRMRLEDARGGGESSPRSPPVAPEARSAKASGGGGGAHDNIASSGPPPPPPLGFSAGGFWLVEADPMPSLTCGPRTFWLAARPAKVSRGGASVMASLASLEGGESVPETGVASLTSLASGSTRSSSSADRSRLARPAPPTAAPSLLNLAALRAVQRAVSGNMDEMARVSGNWLEAARRAGWSTVPPPLSLSGAELAIVPRCEPSISGQTAYSTNGGGSEPVSGGGGGGCDSHTRDRRDEADDGEGRGGGDGEREEDLVDARDADSAMGAGGRPAQPASMPGPGQALLGAASASSVLPDTA